MPTDMSALGGLSGCGCQGACAGCGCDGCGISQPLLGEQAMAATMPAELLSGEPGQAA